MELELPEAGTTRNPTLYSYQVGSELHIDFLLAEYTGGRVKVEQSFKSTPLGFACRFTPLSQARCSVGRLSSVHLKSHIRPLASSWLLPLHFG
jgi:hypothetical protein